MACLDRLLLTYGHDTTALKVFVTGLGQVHPGSLLRARIVTFGCATFAIAMQRQCPQLLQSLDVEKCLIRQSAIVSGRQDFLLEDQFEVPDQTSQVRTSLMVPAEIGWSRTHWRTVLFTNKTHFILTLADGCARVYRNRGDRFAPNCKSVSFF